MEQLLVQLLTDTQSSNEAQRTQAEQRLHDLCFDQNYPITLCSLAAHSGIKSSTRQAALLALKNFVLAGWSPALDEFKGQILVNDETKATLRNSLFELATSDSAERKIQNAASYVVSKIAAADYPDDWDGLLPALLLLIPQASDARLHGALKILAELVDDGFSVDQFFSVAQDMINVLHKVAGNEQKTPFLRALAMSVFRGCFDTLEMVLEDHKAAVKSFADGTLNTWMPLFQTILKSDLPILPPSDDHGRGVVALKLQAVKVCTQFVFEAS